MVHAMEETAVKFLRKEKRLTTKGYIYKVRVSSYSLLLLLGLDEMRGIFNILKIK
jgi:hypothetical protein